VVEDRVPEGFGGQVQPRSAIYLSALQLPPQAADLLLRPGKEFSAERARQLLSRAGVHPASPQSEKSIVAREAGPLAWFGRWFSVLGWAMLLVTTASTFVLMRLWVRSLRPELGLRRAVGARRHHLFTYVLARAALTAFAGVVGALWFGPALWDTLPEMVAGLPGWSLGLAGPLALILLGIALAGALLPAIVASRETPTGLIGSAGE
jgi:putative ABC transport system permease protein